MTPSPDPTDGAMSREERAEFRAANIEHGNPIRVGPPHNPMEHTLAARLEAAAASVSPARSSLEPTAELLSPEIRAAIEKVDADCRRVMWGGDKTLATIYEILALKPDQGTDIPGALTSAMLGDGYMLSHQRRLLAIVAARALTELATLVQRDADRRKAIDYATGWLGAMLERREYDENVELRELRDFLSASSRSSLSETPQ